MVVLQHGPIVVKQRGVRPGHDVEIVGGAGVFEIMDQSGDQRRKYI